MSFWSNGTLELTMITSHMAIGNMKHVAEAIVRAWSRLLSWFWKCRRQQSESMSFYLIIWIRKKIARTKEYEQIDWTWDEYEIITFNETRRAITLLSADKIPAKIGIAISFIPNTCSGWTSASRWSLNGKFRLSYTIEGRITNLKAKNKAGMGGDNN